MSIEGRIRKLESRFDADPIILHFADGATRELRGPRYFLLDLVVAASRGANRSTLQTEQLELIGHTVDADEPGGGHYD